MIIAKSIIDTDKVAESFEIRLSTSTTIAHNVDVDMHHRYSHKGIYYPSTTQIISNNADVPDTEEVLLGSLVHSIFESLLHEIIEDGEDINSIDIPEDQQVEYAYVINTIKLIQKLNITAIASELRFINLLYGYAGTIDYIGVDKQGNLWLLDLKSSESLEVPSRSHELQVSAYSKVLSELGYKNIKIGIILTNQFQARLFAWTYREKDFEKFLNKLEVLGKKPVNKKIALACKQYLRVSEHIKKMEALKEKIKEQILEKTQETAIDELNGVEYRAVISVSEPKLKVPKALQLKIIDENPERCELSSSVRTLRVYKNNGK